MSEWDHPIANYRIVVLDEGLPSALPRPFQPFRFALRSELGLWRRSDAERFTNVPIQWSIVTLSPLIKRCGNDKTVDGKSGSDPVVDVSHRGCGKIEIVDGESGSDPVVTVYRGEGACIGSDGRVTLHIGLPDDVRIGIDTYIEVYMSKAVDVVPLTLGPLKSDSGLSVTDGSRWCSVLRRANGSLIVIEEAWDAGISGILEHIFK
jgi:hypothetical protein